MARYRLVQHSRYSRVNVDVFLEDPSSARRWLDVTPDTYRVRLSLPTSGETTEFVTVQDESLPVDDALVNRAVVALGDGEIGAGVVGEVAGPGLAGRLRSEPTVGPRAIAVRSTVLDEVGGVPAGTHPLPGLLSRLRDAGHRIGLIPIGSGDAPTGRSDSIDRDLVLILAAVPLHDIGGGARSTQLALEMVRRGRHVTLVSLYEAQESVDLGLRFIHPALEQFPVGRFDPHRLSGRARRPGLILIEAPADPLIQHAIALQQEGWAITYDMIDDWSDSALGGEWYRPGVERDLIAKADRVVASAPDLVRRVGAMGGEAELVPNAVNATVFGVETPPRPADFPEAGTIIGYHGSLYGDWFDWGSLLEVAVANPEAALVLIGDARKHPTLPSNVHMLGLKAQTDLPAYVQRFDVGMIPFRINDTTHAVSPLKAYEYLASGVPIAAPPLRSLEGLDGVFTNEDLRLAVMAALRGPRPDRSRALAEHSWQERVSRLIKDGTDPATGTPVRIVIRPVVHFDRAERLVDGTDDPS
jgi:hypothetical protein